MKLYITFNALTRHRTYLRSVKKLDFSKRYLELCAFYGLDTEPELEP
jgi:hypothetical protein